MAKEKFTITDGITCPILDLESAIKEMQIDGNVEAKKRVSLCTVKKQGVTKPVRDEAGKMVKENDEVVKEPDIDKKTGKQKTTNVLSPKTLSWDDCDDKQKKWVAKAIEYVLRIRLKKIKTKKKITTELSDE